MFNAQQKAIIKKDIKGITQNKRYFSVLTILPLLFSVVFPTIFILSVSLVPQDSSSFVQIARMMPDYQLINPEELPLELSRMIFNTVLPIFFLIIPIMTSTVMAASSFIGEKEKRTLETLFYSPLSIREIFQSKVYGSFLIGVAIAYVSVILTNIVVQIEMFLLQKTFLIPSINWLWIMLLLVPSITMISIVFIVKGSAKSNSIEEAQQKAVFLILPLLLLIIGQFTGLLFLGGTLIFGLGVVLNIITFVLLRYSMTGFTYEQLLN